MAETRRFSPKNISLFTSLTKHTQILGATVSRRERDRKTERRRSGEREAERERKRKAVTRERENEQVETRKEQEGEERKGEETFRIVEIGKIKGKHVIIEATA